MCGTAKGLGFIYADQVDLLDCLETIADLTIWWSTAFFDNLYLIYSHVFIL